MALPYLITHVQLPLEPSGPPCLMSTSSDSFGLPEVKASDSYHPLATSLLSSSSSPSPRSSLYLAVKVRSLVNSLRKRVKRRSHAVARKKADDTPFCRDIEREAYRAIDRYLGRRPKPKRATASRSREGVKKAIGINGVALSHDKVDIKKLLANIDRAAGFNALPLTTLAAHDELFLSRKADLVVKRLSINELQHLIVNVRDILDTLHRTVRPDSSAFASPFDGPAEFACEPAYLANLTHLLLCLQSQLLCQLVHRCVELVRAHIIECQRTHQRSCEDWFFEYPNARHPLSTTWPWAIKPSLAVLWGVCWMFPAFYLDKEGNVIDRQGNILISYLQLAQLNSDPVFASGAQRNTQQRTPQRNVPISSCNIANQQMQMSSASVLYPKAGAYPPPPQLGAGSSGQPRLTSSHLSHLSDRAMMSAQPPPATQRNRANNNSSRPYSAHAIHAIQNQQAPGSFLGLVPADSNTTYSAQPATHSVAGGSDSWLPEDANFPIHPPQGYNAYLEQPGVYQQQWPAPEHASQEHLLVPQSAHTRGNSQCSPLRSRSKGQVTPAITVTTEQPYTPDSQVQPQDSHHTSATSIIAPYTYDEIPVYYDNNIPYSQRHNSEMADIQVPPQVGQVGQVGPSNGIASPISDHPDLSRPISPAPMTDPNLRKRSFSEMSQGPPPHMQMVPTDQQSPQGVAYETSPNGGDDAGHKVQRMIKRGDPPQAHDGKYYCNFAPECADQYFDRKCEWSKHMDKHDRPYRCPQAQCAKLQGFTYSGGLLRHEREVHGKHGGPKEQLRCTVPDCKRHTGKGFTRKENLNEHLRRVHGITSTTDTSHLRQIAADAAPGADLMETPASRFSDTGEVDDFSAAPPAYPDLTKRRRLDPSVSGGSDDLEIELQRLKADNREKDERIRGLEEKEAEREARLKSLEDRLMEFTHLQRVPDQAHMGTYPDFNGSVDAMQQAQEPQ